MGDFGDCEPGERCRSKSRDLTERHSQQGVFGFLIGLAGLLSVKVTSPVSHMVSSAARGVLQTLVSVWFLGDKLTLWVF